MDQVTLDSIRQIVEKATWNSPAAYVGLAIAVLAPAFTAFFGAYLKKRAETAAIKDDLDEIKEQLVETTRVAEEVRTAIGFQDWHARESLALKRTRLEELYEQIWLNEEELSIWWRHRALGMDGDPPKSPSAGIARIGGLASLYFPTLKQPAFAYSTAATAFMSSGLDFALQMHDSGPEQQEVVLDSAKAHYLREYPSVHAARESLLDACVALMPEFLSE